MKGKKRIRCEMLAKRNALAEELRKEKSKVITNKLCENQFFQNASLILSYASFRSEVDTWELNQRILDLGKNLYLPRTDVEKQEMFFHRVTDLQQLIPGYQGIMEPISGEIFGADTFFSKEDIVVIMPGAAYDEKGYRTGYGGGYYDRFLATWKEKVTSIFVAFEEQGCKELPLEDTDQKPDFVIVA